MESEKTSIHSRKKERLFLLLTAIALLLLFCRLFFVEQRNFADVPQRLKDGTMINLNAGNVAKNIGALLRKGYYFEDPRDVDLIVNTVGNRIKAGTKFDN